MKETPWGPVGYITYKRTYARRLKANDANSPTEEFEQTVDRIIEACDKQLKVGFPNKEEKRLKEIMLGLKGIVAGRFLWQLGTPTVKQIGLASLQNCAFTVVDHPIRPFTWAMDMLMLGSGVGYNIQKEYVYELPKARRTKITRQDTKDADFIVPDSREGWVELLRKTLEAHFITGKGFTYSTICIRGKGEPIKGFGGLASGPNDLCWGIEEINKLLNGRAGKKVRPIDCLDLMNIIGMVVVAGNVRRSAQIAIGDMDDLQFLNAKNWNQGNIPNWRAMSNNSVVCNDINQLPEQYWKNYLEEGECYGLINLALARKIGRVDEDQYPDPEVVGFNPCQPGFATVMTPGGIKTFHDIEIGDKIWSKEGWTTIKDKWSTGIKPVYEYRTTGGVFVGTSNHRVDTPNGKVEVQDAKKVLTIAGPDLYCQVGLDPKIIADGLFLGDGYHKKMAGRDYTYPILIVGKDDEDYFNSEIKNYIRKLFQDRGDNCKEYRFETTISAAEKQKAYDLEIPDRYYLKNRTETRALLRGLYSADGSVIKQNGNSYRVTYKTASKKMAHQVQQMLSFIGIRSYITSNQASDVEFNNGIYTYKQNYDVNITRDVERFVTNIGFIQKYKNEKINLEEYNPQNTEAYTKMNEIISLGDYEVFDITVDNESHTYWTGGLSVSNCAEQSLAPFETCCLAEVYLPNIETKDELLEVCKYLYRINKHSLALKCHHPETQAIVHKNMRMGIGVTGYLQATKKQRSWLKEVYDDLRLYDRKYSNKHGFPTSIKLTTVKPSGTLSLLAGVTPGAHPGFSHFHIRRIRMASNIPLVDLCRAAGYHVEWQRGFDGSEDRNTVVVSFPCKFPKTTKVATDMTAIDQLEIIKELQTNWSDNAVSVTIYYRKKELPEIKAWLSKNFNDNLKTVSFLRHSDHGFTQAPLEEITEQEYNKMIKEVTPLTSIEAIDEASITAGLEECEGGFCPIK